MNRKSLATGLTAAGIFFFGVSAMAAPAVIGAGKKVKMNFTLESEGKVLDKTFETTPFEFVFGSQSMIPGLQKGVEGLKSGDEKKVVLKPEEAFGPVNPKAVVEVPKERFTLKEIKPGMMFTSQGKDGRPLHGQVKEVRDTTVLLDFNHPLAGKTVQFNVHILEVS